MPHGAGACLVPRTRNGRRHDENLAEDETLTIGGQVLMTAPDDRQAIASESPRYLAWMNPWRFVAMVSVVWIHTPRSPGLVNATDWARFAVPFFTASAVYLAMDAARRNPLRPWRTYVVSRAMRLYVPFLAWSAIYLAAQVVRDAILPGGERDRTITDLLVWGSAYHLWYIPFVALVTAMGYGLARWAIQDETFRAHVAWVNALLGCAALLLADRIEATDLRDEIKYAWSALPAAFLTCSLFAAWWLRSRGQPVSRPFARLGTLSAACGIAWLHLAGRNSAVETLAGLALLVAALGPSFPSWLAGWRGVTSLSFGVYLSHLLFIKTAQSVIDKTGCDVSVGQDLAVYLLAVGGSLALTGILMRVRGTRWLIA